MSDQPVLSLKQRCVIALRNVATELRNDPKRWTKHCMARSSWGNATLPNNPNAVCWCTQGFVEREVRNLEEEGYYDVSFDALHQWLQDELTCRDLRAGTGNAERVTNTAYWNDNIAQSALEVAELFEAAAHRLEAR